MNVDSTQWIKRPAAYALPALMLFLLFQACGGSNDAEADTPESLEGVWESVATRKDCATGAVTGTFLGAQVVHRGGTMTDTNANPPTTRGPGFGTWTGSGSNFVVRFRFYNYDTTGQVTGVTRVTRNVTVAADGNTSTSNNTGTIENLQGAVVLNICASDLSTKVK